MNNSTTLPPPMIRPLRVFAFDPSRGRLLGNEMQLDIPYRPLAPGPIDLSGARDQLAVIDYDATRKKYYQPIDLDDRLVLIENGLTPSECDPRFHQQMVYAVASDTITQFESALGRRIHWRRAERPRTARRGWLPEDILTLTLYPHAMMQANAFYSPESHGILFGYFKASGDNVGHNLPGQTVFTCLSHDVIVHEMTHAILDGLRSHFMEQTNPDVTAFHEAFADLAALFRHFSHREVLLNAVQRTGGRLYTPALKGDPLADQADKSWLPSGDEDRNPLIELAGQFGEAVGLRQGLRSAIGKPKTIRELQQPMDCHERGSILVAAVFEAFFTIYLVRAANHFRIYRAAGGVDRDDLPDPLASALCDEATRTAQQFFVSCVRALDYLPPVDVTFGDFLRAVLTSESDFDPEDHEGICDAWMQAFLRRQLLPDDALYFSEEGLRYPLYTDRIAIENLPSGGALGLSYSERQSTGRALRAFMRDPRIRRILDLEPDVSYTIPSFHPLYRTDRRGGVRWDLVAEIVQTSSRKGWPLRGGTTVIFSTHSAGGGGREDTTFVRYIISKPLGGRRGIRRGVQEANFLEQQGVKPNTKPSSLRVNFGLVHGGS